LVALVVLDALVEVGPLPVASEDVTVDGVDV
jgi:hypothetical protein